MSSSSSGERTWVASGAAVVIGLLRSAAVGAIMSRFGSERKVS
jgi:hypothetical protein